jgi:hypothetical protein
MTFHDLPSYFPAEGEFPRFREMSVRQVVGNTMAPHVAAQKAAEGIETEDDPLPQLVHIGAVAINGR